MDDTATHPLDPTVFDANLSALGPILPASAEALASARPPDGMVLTRGRDGEPTFS